MGSPARASAPGLDGLTPAHTRGYSAGRCASASSSVPTGLKGTQRYSRVQPGYSRVCLPRGPLAATRSQAADSVGLRSLRAPQQDHGWVDPLPQTKHPSALVICHTGFRRMARPRLSPAACTWSAKSKGSAVPVDVLFVCLLRLLSAVGSAAHRKTHSDVRVDAPHECALVCSVFVRAPASSAAGLCGGDRHGEWPTGCGD